LSHMLCNSEAMGFRSAFGSPHSPANEHPPG
jgi:hypothetical protein